MLVDSCSRWFTAVYLSSVVILLFTSRCSIPYRRYIRISEHTRADRRELFDYRGRHLFIERLHCLFDLRLCGPLGLNSSICFARSAFVQKSTRQFPTPPAETLAVPLWVSIPSHGRQARYAPGLVCVRFGSRRSFAD